LFAREHQTVARFDFADSIQLPALEACARVILLGLHVVADAVARRAAPLRLRQVLARERLELPPRAFDAELPADERVDLVSRGIRPRHYQRAGALLFSHRRILACDLRVPRLVVGYLEDVLVDPRQRLPRPPFRSKLNGRLQVRGLLALDL